MRLRWLFWCLTLVLAVQAQTRMTVRELTTFIESAQKLKQSDKEVAQMLRDMKLSEKLDERTLEDLQSKAVGPRTLDALRQMRDASASLPAPAPPAPKQVIQMAPPPDSVTQGKIIEETREYAMNYTKSLPNFLCTQVTRRYVDPSGMEFWHLADTLTTRLSFFEQKEDYKVILVNNRPTNLGLEQLGGTVSTGEFGTVMKELFSVETHAQFDWERWATLRGRRAYVFRYRVPQEYSKWHIVAQQTYSFVPGYTGLVYIDRDTSTVLRITQDAEGLPPTFPVQQIHALLDYDFVKINENENLLPLRASNQSRMGKYLTKNEVEFRLYRKFGAETNITFDTPAPLSDDKTKEGGPVAPKK